MTDPNNALIVLTVAFSLGLVIGFIAGLLMGSDN